MQVSLKLSLLFISLSASVHGVAKEPTTFIRIDGDDIRSAHIDAEMNNLESQLEGLAKKEKSKALRALRKEALKQIIERKSMVNHLKHSSKTKKDFISELSQCVATNKKAKLDLQHQSLKKCEEKFIRSHFHHLKMHSFIITDGDIRRKYEKNKTLFKTPKKVMIRHILFATYERARSIYYKLKPSNFESYAEMYSIAAEANSGGLMGPFAKGSVPDVFNQCFELPTKGISKIIRSEYGFHVFMVIKKYPASQQSLEEVSFKIENQMRDIMSEKAYEETLTIAMKRVQKTSKPTTSK